MNNFTRIAAKSSLLFLAFFAVYPIIANAFVIDMSYSNYFSTDWAQKMGQTVNYGKIAIPYTHKMTRYYQSDRPTNYLLNDQEEVIVQESWLGEGLPMFQPTIMNGFFVGENNTITYEKLPSTSAVEINNGSAFYFYNVGNRSYYAVKLDKFDHYIESTKKITANYLARMAKRPGVMKRQ